MKNRLASALAILWVTIAPAFAQHQAPLQTPTTGPHSATDFTTNYLNPALLAAATQNWGPTAPANGPGGVAAFGQWWLNTSVSTAQVLSIYDGTAWAPLAQFSSTTHQWSTVADWTVNGALRIAPTAGTTNQGLVVSQTLPSGSAAGPIFGNVLTYINPGLTATGVGTLDPFGQINNQVVGLRINYASSGPTTQSNNIAFGVAHYITAATDAAGGAIGMTSDSSAVGGSYLWGFIGYANVRAGATAGLLIGIDSEVGIATGGSALYRIGVGADSQGPVTGTTLDSAFAVTASSNVLPGGGTVTGWDHFLTVAKNVYFSAVSPIKATGDFLFSDSAFTTTHFANLGMVTFTGNYFDFQKMAVRGTDGAAVFGAGVAGLPGSGVNITAPSSGNTLITSSPNGASGSSGVTIKDSSANNIMFAGLAEASNTGVRFGHTQGNWAELVAQGSTNAGMMIGTLTSVPFIIGTNNTARMTLSGAGDLALTAATLFANGSAIFGITGGSVSAGSVLSTCTSCGSVFLAGVPNSGNNGDGVTINDASTNNVAFFGVQEPTSSAVRFGQTVSNWGQLVVQGSTNAGLGIGTLTNVPLILGTNNTARITIAGSGAITVAPTATFTLAPVFSDQSGSRTSLGLGTMATQAASAVAITGGTINGTLGGTTPAAATVTTMTASTSVTSPIHAAAGSLTFQSNGSTQAGAIDASQLWVIGPATTPLSGTRLLVTNNSGVAPNPGFSPTMQVVGADGAQGTIALFTFQTGLAQAAINYYKARGTAASPAGLSSGDRLASNFALGYATSGGAGYVGGAGFVMVATDNFTSTVAGTRLDLQATPTGTATAATGASVGAGLMVGNTNDPAAGQIRMNSAAFLMRNATAWTNGAAAALGTLSNAPAAGNPTKWIPVDDNGTTRMLPAW